MLLPLLMNLGMFGLPPAGSSSGRKVRRYLERDGKILVFSSAKQIEAYLEAEAEANRVFADGFKPKKIRIKPKVIDVEFLKTALPQEVKRIDYLFETKDIDELLLIQAAILNGEIRRYLKMIEDENDIEILLLSIQ